jgi:hypothetical protein
MKLRIFKISFKLYYRELCDWGSEYVKAKNKRAALRNFAKRHGLQAASVRDPESWRWWEDDWYNAFHAIEEVSSRSKICAACKGVGTVGG